MTANPRPLVMHVVTVPMSLGFLSDHARAMRAGGLDVEFACGDGPGIAEFEEREQAAVHRVPLVREIAPAADANALGHLFGLFRRRRPAIVDAHTPKAGLLAMAAATLCATPVRMYHLHGLRFSGESGGRQRLLRHLERLTCRLSHRTICVSRSLARQIVSEGICRPGKAGVLAAGSVNGVDATTRFVPAHIAAHRERVRRACGIPEDAVVLGFVGRLHRDKGLRELHSAWAQLAPRHPRLHLLIVGPNEANEPDLRVLLDHLAREARVHVAGAQPDMPQWYSAMDLLCLPTYREGLPGVLLEAAAMGLPAVATSVTGCVDVIEEGRTGLLVPPRDHVALARAIDWYLERPAARSAHGLEARKKVLAQFDPAVVRGALLAEYHRMLGAPHRGWESCQPVGETRALGSQFALKRDGYQTDAHAE